VTVRATQPGETVAEQQAALKAQGAELVRSLNEVQMAPIRAVALSTFRLPGLVINGVDAIQDIKDRNYFGLGWDLAGIALNAKAPKSARLPGLIARDERALAEVARQQRVTLAIMKKYGVSAKEMRGFESTAREAAKLAGATVPPNGRFVSGNTFFLNEGLEVTFDIDRSTRFIDFTVEEMRTVPAEEIANLMKDTEARTARGMEQANKLWGGTP
jgi:hypothetical protein